MATSSEVLDFERSSMKLRIDPAAESETREAADWYERQRSGLGREFLVAIDDTVQRIRRNPLQFARLETVSEEYHVHRALLERLPYAVIYEAARDEIRIPAAAHTKRRPNYWKDRQR